MTVRLPYADARLRSSAQGVSTGFAGEHALRESLWAGTDVWQATVTRQIDLRQAGRLI